MAQLAVPGAPDEHHAVRVQREHARRRRIHTDRVDRRRRGQLGRLLSGLAHERLQPELGERAGVHRELEELGARGEHPKPVLLEEREARVRVARRYRRSEERRDAYGLGQQPALELRLAHTRREDALAEPGRAVDERPQDALLHEVDVRLPEGLHALRGRARARLGERVGGSHGTHGSS